MPKWKHYSVITAKNRKITFAKGANTNLSVLYVALVTPPSLIKRMFDDTYINILSVTCRIVSYCTNCERDQPTFGKKCNLYKKVCERVAVKFNRIKILRNSFDANQFCRLFSTFQFSTEWFHKRKLYRSWSCLRISLFSLMFSKR